MENRAQQTSFFCLPYQFPRSTPKDVVVVSSSGEDDDDDDDDDKVIVVSSSGGEEEGDNIDEEEDREISEDEVSESESIRTRSYVYRGHITPWGVRVPSFVTFGYVLF